MNQIIPYGKQEITEPDLTAVVNILKSDFLTQGPAVGAFEKAFSEYIGCKYSVAVANGTAALHLCAMALNVKPGDKVIVPPISFAASANCVKYCGGDVVFSDIDASTLTLDIEKVRTLLKSAPMGTYQGIIPVDFGGHPVQMDAFRTLAEEYGMWIIEDACHAPGAYFSDSKNVRHNCGNGEYADLAIFSFHPVKHIAAGEGGMITTNDEALYKRLLTLRTHGITRDQSVFKNSIAEVGGDPTTGQYPGWYMEMQELGYNYRLTDFQAALGQSQLERADSGMEKRLAIAAKYEAAFSTIKGIHSTYVKNPSGEKFRNGHHLYIIEVADRLGLYNYLRSKNILAQIHYYPIHLMPYYRALGSKPGDMPVAENYYAHCISLPMYPSLKDEEQAYVIDCIIKYINE